jgi:hypothetical protein
VRAAGSLCIIVLKYLSYSIRNRAIAARSFVLHPYVHGVKESRLVRPPEANTIRATLLAIARRMGGGAPCMGVSSHIVDENV